MGRCQHLQRRDARHNVDIQFQPFGGYAIGNSEGRVIEARIAPHHQRNTAVIGAMRVDQRCPDIGQSIMPGVDPVQIFWRVRITHRIVELHNLRACRQNIPRDFAAQIGQFGFLIAFPRQKDDIRAFQPADRLQCQMFRVAGPNTDERERNHRLGVRQFAKEDDPRRG